MTYERDQSLDFPALFKGALQFFPPNSQTTELADFGRSVVRDCFGEKPLDLSKTDFREALSKARSAFENESTRRYAQNILISLRAGEQIYLDQIRLRAVTPGLENISAAAAVFFGHRDTWYGNPSCQINAWIPLHSVSSCNSFRFFPGYFETEIANDSADFRASDFRKQGGFGRVDVKNPSVYPRMLEQPQGGGLDIAMDSDEILAFSAAHLHQSLPNRTSKARFSLDFRFLRKSDLDQGLGAPDPDNRSSGLLMEDYRLCHC